MHVEIIARQSGWHCWTVCSSALFIFGLFCR